MTIQDIMSGAWGAGGASLVGAFIILFIRRFINDYDKKTTSLERKITKLDETINHLQITITKLNSDFIYVQKVVDKLDK